jgi:hypothetical protein
VTWTCSPPVTKSLERSKKHGSNDAKRERKTRLAFPLHANSSLAMKGVKVEIHLARVKHEVMKLLEKDGVDQNIGRDHIHAKVVEAVQLFTQKEKPVARNDQ